MTGLLIVSLAPVFIIAFYIYFRDKYEKEPWSLLLKAMAAGALTVLPVIFFEKAIGLIGLLLPPVGKAAWDAFAVAALCEEAFKYAALYMLIWNHKEFNEKFDGIVYATFVSLGFAMAENILYVMDSGMATGLVRAFTAVPAHALFGITMGFFFGLAKFYPKKRKRYLIWAFCLPFVLHGIYDFILMSGLNVLLWLFVPFIVFLWLSGLSKLKSLNKSSVFNTDIDLGIDFKKVHDYYPDKPNETVKHL